MTWDRRLNCVVGFILLAGCAAVAGAQTITSISPASVSAGSSYFALTVNGTDLGGTIVLVNNVPRYTVHFSSTTVKAPVFAWEVASPGTLVITVYNAYTGGSSNQVALTVTDPNAPPPPPPPTTDPPPPADPPPTNPPPQPPPAGVVGVNITSPVQNQTVCSPVTLLASATTTNVGASLANWSVYDEGGNLVWSTAGPASSIQPSLTFAAGSHTLQIKAFDSAGTSGYTNVTFTVSTASPPCGGNVSGPVTAWRGCMLNDGGLQYQAIQFTLSQPALLSFNATLYNGANCDPTRWADQIGFGTQISFGAWGYEFWFIHFWNQPNTSAIWTVGNQSSGCINYNAVPACN